MFRVYVEQIAPSLDVRRVMIDPHPSTHRPRQVGVCGMSWADGWSLINRTPPARALNKRERRYLEAKLKEWLEREEIRNSVVEVEDEAGTS